MDLKFKFALSVLLHVTSLNNQGDLFVMATHDINHQPGSLGKSFRDPFGIFKGPFIV